MDSSTKERIIDVAIEIFLTKGIDVASNRDICASAQANVAAINYHFGTKDALRAAVLERIMSACSERYPLEEGVDQTQSPQERLCLCIRNFARLVFPADPENARRAKLFWVELGNPSEALLPVLDRFLRPIRALFEAAIQDVIGSSDQDTLRRCVESIIGQIIVRGQDRIVLTRLYGDEGHRPRDIECLVAHVCLFALAGLEAVRASLKTQ
jgi:AcrR family transcriptional regulator